MIWKKVIHKLIKPNKVSPDWENLIFLLPSTEQQIQVNSCSKKREFFTTYPFGVSVHCSTAQLDHNIFALFHCISYLYLPKTSTHFNGKRWKTEFVCKYCYSFNIQHTRVAWLSNVNVYASLVLCPSTMENGTQEVGVRCNGKWQCNAQNHGQANNVLFISQSKMFSQSTG